LNLYVTIKKKVMDTSTCIVAVKQDGKVWMGADSAASNKEAFKISTRADSKIFIREDAVNVKWLFGFTTSYRMGQLIQYMLELPTFDEEASKDPFSFIVKKFIPLLQKCLGENGFQEKEKDRIKGGTFLIGLAGNIFRIAEDYQVATLSVEYDAIGCGEPFALGALFASKDKLPKERIEIALSAAEEFSAGVRGPFVILEV
jgi:ATP-dependent protease HslVU (ClpYQ) peptidase subunit